jgi:hypothetical protein
MSDSSKVFGDNVTPDPFDWDPNRRTAPGNAAADAATQAAAGEARVISTNQDTSATGQPDADSGQAVQRAGIAMPPADSPQLTRDPDA